MRKTNTLNKKKANFNDTLSLRVQKPTGSNLRIYLSLSNFTIITLPTQQYYLGKPLDLTSNENVFFLLIEKWVYRNDFWYGGRQIYFGNDIILTILTSLKVFLTWIREVRRFI